MIIDKELIYEFRKEVGISLKECKFWLSIVNSESITDKQHLFSKAKERFMYCK